MIHASRGRAPLVLMAMVICAGVLAPWAFDAAHTMAAADEPHDQGVRIEYRGKPGDLYYYVIENDVTDDVAIHTQMFRLPSSTTFKDNRTVIQTIAAPREPATQPVRPHLPTQPAPVRNDDLLFFEWEVDRYQASEVVTDMAEVSFDSLKHTHPPKELSGLAKVPGSKVSFRFNGKTGGASNILIQPGPGAHPTDSRQSKTAENGLVTTENMQELLYDMGEQFLPGEPKRVGDQWVIKREKLQQPFGIVTTNTTCKFKSLEKVGNAEIASIDLTGVIFFQANPVKPPPPPPPAIVLPAPTTRPATTMPHYPIAPHPPTPYNPTTRSVPQPTSHPAMPLKQPPNANSPSDSSTRLDFEPSMGEFDPTAAELLPQDQPKVAIKSNEAVATEVSDQATSAPVAPVALSRPVDEDPATSQPTPPPPVTTTPAKPVEEPFQMEGAHFSGSIKFDVTHGRLVELTLRSNAAFVKIMRSDKEEMKIKQGSKHILRIKGSVTPPPRPNIPSGKKPPVEKPPPNARPTVQPVGAASRPAQHGTTQPAAVTDSAVSPAVVQPKQPPVVNKSIAPATPTSQPKPLTPPAE